MFSLLSAKIDSLQQQLDRVARSASQTCTEDTLSASGERDGEERCTQQEEPVKVTSEIQVDEQSRSDLDGQGPTTDTATGKEDGENRDVLGEENGAHESSGTDSDRNAGPNRDAGGCAHHISAVRIVVPVIFGPSAF